MGNAKVLPNLANDARSTTTPLPPFLPSSFPHTISSSHLTTIFSPCSIYTLFSTIPPTTPSSSPSPTARSIHNSATRIASPLIATPNHPTSSPSTTVCHDSLFLSLLLLLTDSFTLAFAPYFPLCDPRRAEAVPSPTDIPPSLLVDAFM